jgi:hypothetical protein
MKTLLAYSEANIRSIKITTRTESVPNFSNLPIVGGERCGIFFCAGFLGIVLSGCYLGGGFGVWVGLGVCGFLSCLVLVVGFV